jgi:hypothetical protein
MTLILTNFLTEEIAWSEAIVRDGEEVVPRFRIFSPEGQYIVFVQFSDEGHEYVHRLRLVKMFMAWKLAAGFVLSAQIKSPEGITSYAVTKDARTGAQRRLERGGTISFGQLEWLDEGQIDIELSAMLPQRHNTLTTEMMRELDEALGGDGALVTYRVSQ